MDEEVLIELPNGKSFPRKVYSEYTADELKEIIRCCRNITHVIDTLRLNRIYYRYLKRFISDNNIDTSHFTNNTGGGVYTSVENNLIKNSKVLNSKRIKQYLFKNNLIVNECSICKLQPLWNNKPLTLQLDHINGDHFDNRVENLRIVCPNCHAQTDTYTGSNVKKHEDKFCQDCNKQIRKDSTTERCAECIGKRKKICSVCETNPKYGNWSKCKECLTKIREIKLCKVCNEEIKRATNKTDYHKKCFTKKNTEKE
jgi:hypothetical protein